MPLSSPLAPAAPGIEALYVAHHGWLQGWLTRKLSSAADAADIAQDTFVRVLAARTQALMAEPRAYLRTIAKGLVIDQWRRQELERAYLEALAAQPEPMAPSPETRLLILQTLETIDRLLDGLKPRTRAAFLLVQLEGWSHQAIAEHLSVSVRSVERYVADALYHCHLALADDGAALR